MVKDTEEQYHDPDREEDIEGRNRTRLTLWEKYRKNPIVSLDETLKYVENPHYWDCSLTRGLFDEFGFQWLVVERTRSWWFVGKDLSLRGSVGQRAFTRSVRVFESFKEVWTIRWAFFLLHLEKETVVLSELVEFGSCVSAETVKERTLIDLHMLATENVLCSDRDSSLVLREIWKYSCPKNLIYSSEDYDEEGSENTSSEKYYEYNNENLVIQVVGQNWSSEVIPFFCLENWDVGRLSFSWLLSLTLMCPEMKDSVKGVQSLWILFVPYVRNVIEALWWNCHSSIIFLSSWTDCEHKGQGFDDGNEGEVMWVTNPSEWCWSVSFLRNLDVNSLEDWKEDVHLFSKAWWS